MIDEQDTEVGGASERSGSAGLAVAFGRSAYAQARYEHWPLGRRVHAFLAEQRGIQDYESVFVSVYSSALAASRGQIVAAV